MSARMKNQFTIYDALEKAGYFESNPANSYSRDPTTGESTYKGPVQYPKMLYHPEGEMKIINPSEIIVTPIGPKEVGEQRELIYAIAEDEASEQALLAEGWHDHPAKAIRARVLKYIESQPRISEKEKALLMKQIPSISSDQRIKQLEDEIRRLTEARATEAAIREMEA